jgi:hypothetical protein
MEYKMSKKAYRVRSWSQYNKSLVKRGDLTFWFSDDLLENWDQLPQQSAHGNQRYSEVAITCALTLRQLFRLTLRATQGFVQSLLRLVGSNKSSPHYSTLCRRAKTLVITWGATHPKEPLHVLVDSTGVQVLGEREWKEKRYGVPNCRYQTWRKLHIAIDANTQDILAASMTKSTAFDAIQLPILMDQIMSPIEQISADGAYDKVMCYEKAYQIGARPIFPPQVKAAVQRNKYKKNPALFVRDKAVLTVGGEDDRPERLREWKIENNYYRRSLVETAMFRMKTLFTDQIRSKCFENQRTDLLIRCLAVNKINSLGMPLSESI